MMTPVALLFLVLIQTVAGKGSGEDNSTKIFLLTSKCGSMNCPSGQDCLTINGAQMCVDPCNQYTILNNPKRSTSFSQYPDLYVNDWNTKWDGWYRLLLGGVSAKMPESCVDEFMCGTLYPLWLNDRHPRPEEGVVRSKICGVSGNSCCHYDSNEINVRACPGNFFIYKLVVPNISPSAYCAEVSAVTSTILPEPPKTTTPLLQTTTATTRAPSTTRSLEPSNKTTTPKPSTTISLVATNTPGPKSTSTIKAPQTNSPTTTTITPEPPTTDKLVVERGTTTAPQPETTTQGPVPSPTSPKRSTLLPALTPDSSTQTTPILAPQLVCEQRFYRVVLHNSDLTAVGLDASSAHLANPLCSAQGEANGTVWFQADIKEGSCGNTLKTNGTHAIVSNSLFVYWLAGGDSPPHPVRIHFSCIYPMLLEASLDVAVRPYLSMEGAGLVSVGSKARASMSLYHDSNYTQPYPAGQSVSVSLGSILYVSVSVEDTNTEQFVVILDDCYATHSPSPEDLIRYYLIQHRCPSDRRRVTVAESGSSLRARFSVLLFVYEVDYRDVFLHCSLSLCHQRSPGSCTPNCSRRTFRSVSQTFPIKPSTIGPIAWDKSGVSENN